MSDSLRLVRRSGPVPEAGGRPAVVQGRYGSRGNLELVYPDPDDGIWVCWFNGDEPDSEPVRGALPGEWSGGLHFASGRRYDEVDLIQARRGPDFLELVATAGRRIEHWTWTPETGFVSRGHLPGGPGAAAAIGETGAGLAVAAVDGLVVRGWAGAADAPSASWTCSDLFELPRGTQAYRTHVGGDGRVEAFVALGGRILWSHQHARGDWTELIDLGDVVVRGLDACTTEAGGRLVAAATAGGLLTWDGHAVVRHTTDDVAAVSVAPSALECRRVEVITRAAAELGHIRARVGPTGAVEHEAHRPVTSRVLWPAGAPVHRRSSPA